MKNAILVVATLLALTVVGGVACVSSGNGNSIKPLEQMTDLEYSKWKLYIELGVKIGANRLLLEDVVTDNQLNVAADVIDGLTTGPLELDAGSLIAPALRRAGLSNDELELVLLIAEQELAARGALNWVNPVTNVLELSPRSKEVLHIVARSLRAASVVTPKEKSESELMNADFSVRR